MFIRPLTAGHITNRDQHSDLNLNSLKDTESERLKLQSRYYSHQEAYWNQHLKRAAENVSVSPKGKIYSYFL